MSKKKTVDLRYKQGMAFQQTKKPTGSVSMNKFEFLLKLYEKEFKKDHQEANSKTERKPQYQVRNTR